MKVQTFEEILIADSDYNPDLRKENGLYMNDDVFTAHRWFVKGQEHGAKIADNCDKSTHPADVAAAIREAVRGEG